MPHRRDDARGERRERRTDQLEHARLIGRPRGELREQAEHEPDRAGDRDVGQRAAEEHRERAPTVTPPISVEIPRPNCDALAMICSSSITPSAGVIACDATSIRERVDPRELAHVELAPFDAHHPRAELGRSTEARDDRGRRGEHLGFEPESIATRTQPVLESMRRRAVPVQRAAERQHEPDRRLVHPDATITAWYAAPATQPRKRTNARAATQAFERSFDRNQLELSWPRSGA